MASKSIKLPKAKSIWKTSFEKYVSKNPDVFKGLEEVGKGIEGIVKLDDLMYQIDKRQAELYKLDQSIKYRKGVLKKVVHATVQANQELYAAHKALRQLEKTHGMIW